LGEFDPIPDRVAEQCLSWRSGHEGELAHGHTVCCQVADPRVEVVDMEGVFARRPVGGG
jgi:hypothetical protein